MPKFTLTQGDDLVVDVLDRGYLGAVKADTLKIDGASGDVNIKSGKLKIDGTTGVVTRGGSAVPVAASFKSTVVTGRNLAGACTLTGAVVGDKVIATINLSDLTDDVVLFETTVTVANQLQQSSATDLSTKKFLVILVHQN